jgi:hypothetical protein
MSDLVKKYLPIHLQRIEAWKNIVYNIVCETKENKNICINVSKNFYNTGVAGIYGLKFMFIEYFTKKYSYQTEYSYQIPYTLTQPQPTIPWPNIATTGNIWVDNTARLPLNNIVPQWQIIPNLDAKIINTTTHNTSTIKAPIYKPYFDDDDEETTETTNSN